MYGKPAYPRRLEQAWQDHLAPRTDTAPSVVSLFAGAGGSSLGYSMAGFRELLAVENNANALDTFRSNFPGIALFAGDIRALSSERALQLAGVSPGQLDLLDGSPPCQGFSTAGKRDSTDPRNRLFEEFVRLLAAFRPRTFVLENVAGLIRGPMRRLFVEMLLKLRRTGYVMAVRLLDAMYFHVPQSRQRLVFIGIRQDLDRRPSHPGARSQPLSLAQAIGDLPDNQDPRIDHVWLDESPAGRDTRTWHLAHRAAQGQCYAGRQRRYRWDKPCGTLLTPGPGNLEKTAYLRSVGCHPLHTRTLSLLEYKRVGSFPDAFHFCGETGRAYARIGNSVPPLFMRAIAQHVRRWFL